MELENQLKNNIEEGSIEKEKTPLGGAAFQPAPENISIRTMEDDIKSLGGQEEAAKPEEVLPREEKQPELKPETTVQIPGLIEAEKPKKKIWLFAAAGVVAAAVLGLLVYFVVLPLIFQPEKAELPAAVSLPVPEIVEVAVPVLEKHQSYFIQPAFSTARIRLLAVNTANISLALREESAKKLANGQVKEIEVLDNQNSQVSYGEFISKFLSGLDKANADRVFEKDFTAYLYYDQNGVWPGYVAKIKDVSQAGNVMSSFGSFLEQNGQLPSFYLEPAGNFSSFKDGKIFAGATRYSIGSKTGASFNYGAFGNYFVISASFDGLKAALPLLGF